MKERKKKRKEREKKKKKKKCNHSQKASFWNWWDKIWGNIREVLTFLFTSTHHHHPLSPSSIIIIHHHHPSSFWVCVDSRFLSPSGKISWAVFLITNQTSLITHRYQFNSPLYLSSHQNKNPRHQPQRPPTLVQEKNQTQIPHRIKDTYLPYLSPFPRPPPGLLRSTSDPINTLLSQSEVDKANQRD